jgi:hypothetical protein
VLPLLWKSPVPRSSTPLRVPREDYSFSYEAGVDGRTMHEGMSRKERLARFGMILNLCICHSRRRVDRQLDHCEDSDISIFEMRRAFAERRSPVRVAVPVMKIRIVRMGMDHRLMPVPMRMRLRDRPIMLVMVMLIMGMAVFMVERVVLVFMFMPFSKMHP